MKTRPWPRDCSSKLLIHFLLFFLLQFVLDLLFFPPFFFFKTVVHRFAFLPHCTMSLKRSLPVPTTTPEETAATDTRVDTAAFPVEIAHPPPLKKQMLVALSMPTLLPLSPPVDEPVNLAPILTLPNEILQDVIALVAAHSHTDALAFSSTCKTVRIVVSTASNLLLSFPSLPYSFLLLCW